MEAESEVTGGEVGAEERTRQDISETINKDDATDSPESKPSGPLSPDGGDVDGVTEVSKTCLICMGALAEPVFKLTCGHEFCEECVHGYITASVSAGTIDPGCVFVSGEPGAFVTCREKYSEEAIAELLQNDSKTLEKYSRFKFLRENKSGRECPKCEHLQIGQESNHEMICEVCAHTYCFVHGGAHTDRTCAAYEEEIAVETSATNDLLERNSKPCPGCGIYVSKSSGCNHMKCTQCKASFCWICGKKIGDDVFPNHFQWWNPTGCVNMQVYSVLMNEELAPSENTIRMGRIMACLQVAATGLCTALSALLSFFLCGICCIRWGGSRQDMANSARYVCGQHMTVWGGIWLFILVISPAALVLGIIYFIMTVLVILFNVVIYTVKKSIAWYKRVISGEPEPTGPSPAHKISLCPLSIRVNGNYAPPPAQSSEAANSGKANGGKSADLEAAIEQLDRPKATDVSASTYGKLETNPDNVDASEDNLQRMEEGDSGAALSLVVVDVTGAGDDGTTERSDSSVIV